MYGLSAYEWRSDKHPVDKIDELKLLLREISNVLVDVELALDESRNYPVTYDSVITTQYKIALVLNENS